MFATRLFNLSLITLPFVMLALLIALLDFVGRGFIDILPRPILPVATAQLDNGLQIIVIPDHRADVVTHMVVYRVGSADEKAGKSGIAHFFEHLMFRGTPRYPDGAFAEHVAALGGQSNAFTSYDYTAYFERVSSDRLADMMEMEADRMQNLIINPDIVRIERDVILEERSLRTDGNPAALLSEKTRARLYKSRPYAVPVIGHRAEIAALNAQDATAFYKNYYAPDNAILVVAGDVTLAELMPLAQKTYGVLQPQNRPRDPRPQTTNLLVEDWQKPEIRRDARVRQAQWTRYYRLPIFTRAQRKKFAAFEVGMEILGGGTTSRLYQALVINKELAVSVGAFADTVRLNNGEAVIYVTANDGKDFSTLAAAVDAQIKQLIAHPVPPDTLKRAKTQLAAELIFARDSQYTMAQIFGLNAALGVAPQDVLDWPQLIEAVTAQEVQAALADWLQPQHSIVSHLLPEAKLPEAKRGK